MATTTSTLTSARTVSPGEWLRGGLISGAVAGIVFAMAEMMAAVVLSGPGAFFMPLRMIAGIALGMTAMDASTPLATAAPVGLAIHMALSMMYGAAIAGSLALVPRLRRSLASTVAVASLAGLGLWVANFFVFAAVFGWSWFPDGQNVVVQVMAHVIAFGSVLGLLLQRLAFRDAN